MNTMTDRELYLSYFNDFLTVARFAEYYNMTEQQARDLINKEANAQINRELAKYY
jgi:hypothetical protein